MPGRTAVVVTVSDSVTEGTRQDTSGPALVQILLEAGFDANIVVVPDEPDLLSELLKDLSETTALVVTTGGTGFSHRDNTPEATKQVITKDAPGLAEAMRAAGRSTTPFADLSRGVAGVRGSCLIINTPGSEAGAIESLRAIMPIIPHALEHLVEGSTGEHRS